MKNGKDLAENDVLILNNNINIADDTGLGIPTKAVNGSYFLIREVLDQIPERIYNRKKELVANLNFRRLKVKLLGSTMNADAEIILLENYLDGIEELSREEQVAFKIFINRKLADAKNKYPFEISEEYKNLQIDQAYKDVNLKIEKWRSLRKEDEDAGTKRNLKAPRNDLQKYESELNKIKKRYVAEYSNNLLRSLRNSDPFINSALVNYGWAITVHKSVGSSFDSVLLKAIQQEDGGKSNESYFRWLYSGLTASKSKLHILSPQSISPFENCTIVDEVSSDSTIKFIPIRANLSFNNEDVSEDIRRFNSEGLNYNSLVVTNHLLNHLDGYKLENVKKYSDYLIKVTLVSKDNFEAVIAISNKGNKDVSAIRKERSSQEIQPHIDNAIEQLYNEFKSDDFPMDFRNEIYIDWFNILKDQNCSLHLQESHQNEDRFSVTRLNEVVNFNVRYTTGEKNYGFFSSLTIKEKSNDNLAEIIKNLIDND
ncbi:RecD-like DNA helicase Atu2026 [Nonlabens ulvanivorans]|uniref:RecD-like DNA helicase Atu2026 n=1 Tax=Nonlabens ulvanivorans TaxID=906888 RepID=A0A090WBG3_NONUL|nr:helicase C-terminal domain-containing protein [Nonlabens ulvanivorans]GAL74316.1 RecD-like DNA helicase Atu2026 [Nonlabens ulvanivorans]